MNILIWDGAKNELLRQTRGVCFEDAVAAIESGRLLDILEHPDQPHIAGRSFMLLNCRNTHG